MVFKKAHVLFWRLNPGQLVKGPLVVSSQPFSQPGSKMFSSLPYEGSGRQIIPILQQRKTVQNPSDLVMDDRAGPDIEISDLAQAIAETSELVGS
jgi:hypothetical protein